jgi:superfamily II DNA/RNA helicase
METVESTTVSAPTQFFENYVLSEAIPYIDTFEDEKLGLKQEILNGIFANGFQKPSPIQRIGIKPIVDRRDLVLQSHSGSGKTATFVTGLLQVLKFEEKRTQIVVVSNTKELAEQIKDVFLDLSKYCEVTYALCMGGDLSTRYYDGPLTEQVIIGTPGRICDMMYRKMIAAEGVELLIIDEADEVLSSGFRKQVRGIIQSLSKNCQIVLSSATIPQEMSMLVDKILREDHVKILVKDEELTLDEIKQFYVALDDFMKVEVLFDIYQSISIGQCIIYCNTKERADKLKWEFDDKGYQAGILHGSMIAQERKTIMDAFRNGKFRILITTDVMARGIDVQEVSLVINFDMPKYSQTYIHRIGRSGRFGRTGVAINFVTRKEKSILNFIERQFHTRIAPLPQNLQHLI